MENVVIFSENRRRMLRECPRRYWYDVYRSWGGWWYKGQRPASKQAESAYWGKHMTDVYRFAGTTVHELAAWALRTALERQLWERLSLRSTMMARGKSIVDRAVDLATSRGGQNPKRSTRFIEIENGLDFDPEIIRDRVREGVMALTGDGESWRPKPVNLFMRAMETPGSIVSIDEFVQFRVEGVDAFIACDLMMKGRDGESVVILDWKTGRAREEHQVQLDTYGCWAAGRGWSGVTLMAVYLGQSARVDVDVTQIDMATATERMKSVVANFLADLKPRLLDGDLVVNRPIESQFPPTEDRGTCAKCQFKRQCDADLRRTP